jgi:hypothetical protein
MEAIYFVERWKEVANSGKFEQSLEAGDRLITCKVEGNWGHGYIFKRGTPQSKKRTTKESSKQKAMSV